MTDTSLALRTRRPRPFALVVAAASVPMFMATLDNLVMTNALPVLHSEMGASVEELQWFVNAYTLSFASAILVASALGDRFGRRTLFAIGIAVFGAGSVLAALSTDPGQLIAARAVQGLGAAGVMPLSLALLSGAVPPARRALAIGIWGGVSGRASLSGRSSAARSWRAGTGRRSSGSTCPSPSSRYRSPWSCSTTTSAPALASTSPEPCSPAVGVLALVHAIVRGNDDGWDSVGVIVEIVVGALLIAAFLVWQAAREGPADAAATVPRPLVLDHERRRLRVQLRHLRLGVHPHPVPAGRAGLNPARGRRADHCRGRSRR